MTEIAFIGLGHMGNPMACNLLNAGFSVTVYDVVPQAMKALEAMGAKCASNPGIAAKNADIVFTMLQTGAQVKETCLGDEGIFKNAKKNILYIDSSSIDVATTRELHSVAKKIGVNMLDAPVSGGVPGAEGAFLTFMVGGSEENFLQAKPILEKLGKKIVHMGPGGHGQATKICNNLILGISMIGVSEAFSLGNKLGLDPKKFFEISSNASGKCWALTNNCPEPGVIEGVPANHDYIAGFMAKMMLKDLCLAQHAAEDVNAYIPLGDKSIKLYGQYVNEGNGEKDFSGIISLIKNKFSPCSVLYRFIKRMMQR